MNMNNQEPQTVNVNNLIAKLKATSNVYAWTENDISYIKVDLPEIGMYVNSITIRPNPRDPEKLWVQMPKFSTGKSKWTEPLEFQGNSVLREKLIKHALKAYYEYHIGDGSHDDVIEFINDNFP